jgi:hypothetical protein
MKIIQLVRAVRVLANFVQCGERWNAIPACAGREYLKGRAAMDIQKFCESGLELAENEMVTEQLSGNIVKEEHRKGEACAYRAVLAALQNTKVAAPLSVVGANAPSLTPTASVPDCLVGEPVVVPTTANLPQRETITPKLSCAINKRGCVQDVCDSSCAFYRLA